MSQQLRDQLQATLSGSYTIERELGGGGTLAATHERLGQLYEQKGNADKAAEHYRAFIELWKNADPNLQPRVAAARERLKKPTPVERPR